MNKALSIQILIPKGELSASNEDVVRRVVEGASASTGLSFEATYTEQDSDEACDWYTVEVV